MDRAPIIAFSGIDGGGKTTQIGKTLDYLRDRGCDPVYLWVRGGYTPGFQALKNLLRRGAKGALPPPGRTPQRDRQFRRPLVRKAWLTAAILDLFLVYGIGVRWWRWKGRPVVCDRYLWDTLLDFRLNFPDERVEQWWLWRLLAAAVPTPNAAFLLLVPVEESLRRSEKKGEPFPDTAEVLAQRLDFYQAMGRDDGLTVLDGCQQIEDINKEILGIVKTLIGEAGQHRPPQ